MWGTTEDAEQHAERYWTAGHWLARLADGSSIGVEASATDEEVLATITLDRPGQQPRIVDLTPAQAVALQSLLTAVEPSLRDRPAA